MAIRCIANHRRDALPRASCLAVAVAVMTSKNSGHAALDVNCEQPGADRPFDPDAFSKLLEQMDAASTTPEQIWLVLAGLRSTKEAQISAINQYVIALTTISKFFNNCGARDIGEWIHHFAFELADVEMGAGS